jgi:hypothetical protein
MPDASGRRASGQRAGRWRMVALIAALAVVLVALGAFATSMLSTWDRISLAPVSRP